MHDPIPDPLRPRAATAAPPGPATPRRRFCKGLMFGRRHILTITPPEAAPRPADPGKPGRIWV